jgi:hypothetical protein
LPGRSKRRSQTPSLSVFVRVLCFFLLLSFFLFPLPQQIDADSLLHSGQYAQSLRHNTHNAHNAHTHIHRRPNRENNKRATQPAQKTWLFLSAFFPPFPFLSRREPEKGPEANRPEQNKKEHADYKKRNGAVVMTTTFL